MSITRKIFLTLLFFYAAFGLLGIGALIWLILPKFVALERERARAGIEGSAQALQREVDALTTTVTDWRYWDPIHEYALTPNQAFIDENVTSESLESADLDLILILGLKLDVIYALQRDPGVSTDWKARVLDALPRQMAKLGKEPNSDDAFSGIILTSTGPLLLSAGMITNNSGDQPPRGLLVMTRRLRQETIQRIGSQLSLQLELNVIPPNSLIAKGSPGDDLVVANLDAKRLRSSVIIHSLEGIPALELSAVMPRRIRASAIETIETVSLIYLFGGIILAIIFFMALDGLVLKRLTRLNRELNLVSPSNSERMNVTTTGSDEIAHTATTINEMIGRLNSAHALVKQNEAQFRMLTSLAPVGIFLTDTDGQCILVNEQYCAITGIREVDALGMGWTSTLHPDDRERILEESREAVRTSQRFQAECRILLGDGDVRWIKVNAHPVLGEKKVSYLGTITDITNTKERQISLERKALYDELTGLANRILFHDRLQHAYDAGRRRPPHPFAVLFMDLDGFKSVNDHHGHAVGDALLKEVGSRIERLLRPADTASRLGGDEFAVILRDASEVRHCHAVTDRILAAIAEPIMVGPLKITVGISIGAALDHRGYGSANDMVNAADKAMYKAKLGGKNRVVFAQPPTGPPAPVTRQEK